MKIGVLGSGATGCAFASYLMLGGLTDIHLIDLWKEHMDTIRDNGLTFKDHNGERVITGFKTAYTPDDVGLCDLLIVLVKSTQTRDALAGAGACIGENTVVLSLQNGIGNDLALSDFVPTDRIGCGCGRMGTELAGPGHCIARPSQGITNMFVGCIDPEAKEITKSTIQAVAEAFKKGGLNPEYHEDVRPYLWKKACANSGFNTVCAVTRLTMKQAAEDEHALGMVKAILKEGSDVCSALGIADNLYDGLVNDIPTTVKSYGDYYPSMAQDMLIHRRQTEVDTLTGAISEFGRRANVATPMCDALSEVVRAMQANYAVLYRDKA